MSWSASTEAVHIELVDLSPSAILATRSSLSFSTPLVGGGGGGLVDGCRVLCHMGGFPTLTKKTEFLDKYGYFHGLFLDCKEAQHMIIFDSFHPISQVTTPLRLAFVLLFLTLVC